MWRVGILAGTQVEPAQQQRKCDGRSQWKRSLGLTQDSMLDRGTRRAKVMQAAQRYGNN